MLWSLISNGNHETSEVGIALLALFMLFMVAVVRLTIGDFIGEAAERRKSGYGWWVATSLVFGPLLVWIVYLLFVHWRPIVPKIGDSSPSATQ